MTRDNSLKTQILDRILDRTALDTTLSRPFEGGAGAPRTEVSWTSRQRSAIASRVRAVASVASLALVAAFVPALISAQPPAANAAPAEDETRREVIERCNPCIGFEARDEVPTEGITWDLPEGGHIFAHLTGSEAPRESYSGPLTLILDARIATPAPLISNAAALESELATLAHRLERSPADTRVRLLWTGGSPSESPKDWDFLIKRAAVAVTGVSPEAKLLVGFSAPDRAQLDALFAAELAAYVDGIALSGTSLNDASGENDAVLDSLKAFRQSLAQSDPDSELVFLELTTAASRRPASGEGRGADPAPEGVGAVDTTDVLAGAAQVAQVGGQIAVFRLPEVSQAALGPLRLWTREFSGDISFDPFSTPRGARAWSFVRGEDLALRVVVQRPASSGVDLQWSDGSLSTPRLLGGEEPQALYSGRRTRQGYRLEVSALDAPPVFLLSLEREGLGALEGVESVEERLDVEDTRTMPVEEILRRLQASEDAQSRNVRNISATNTTSLRFNLGGPQALDATFRGPFFTREDGGFDWAWQEFYINGVRWRRKKIPEIPLIQPEKATAQPVEITLSKDYIYRLRGSGTALEREAWVIDFEPAIKPEDGRILYQGTLWVDKELYVRLRANAVQLGLTGDVISNEETTTYQALDANGGVVPWSRDAYVLPTKVVGQQIFSVLGSATLVERQVELTDIRVNPEDFEARRLELLASDATMVRDTEKGLRYLIPEGDAGERVVQDELDPSRLFLVGGVFYDESQDYPLPLAGINWLNFNFRDTGAQVNFFFAGPLLLANIADPSFFGSRWNVGIDAFALAIKSEDTFYRDGAKVKEEVVKTQQPAFLFTVGRPLGQFFKLNLEYRIGLANYDRTKDTAEDFVLPQDHIDQRLRLTTDYNRKGYRLRLRGSHSIRSDWQEWGLPGNAEFDQAQEDYQLYGASLRKVWHLPKFTKFGAEIEYAGGDNLDRFSKYQFGFFSDLVVRGYRSDSIRAEEVSAVHLSYGFNLGNVFRVDLVGDAAWATDQLSGLDQELLAGIGLNGTVIGPFGTIVNFDIGFPVAGPESGLTAFIAFLKLFDR